MKALALTAALLAVSAPAFARGEGGCIRSPLKPKGKTSVFAPSARPLVNVITPPVKPSGGCTCKP